MQEDGTRLSLVVAHLKRHTALLKSPQLSNSELQEKTTVMHR